MLPSANILRAIDCDIFCNFEYFNFLNHIKFHKIIEDLWYIFQITSVQEWSPRGDFIKTCSENMLQIYQTTPMF